MNFNYFRILLALLVGINLQSCSSTDRIIESDSDLTESALFIPAGVDSSIAATAVILADSSFVEWEIEEASEQLKEKGLFVKSESDSLWEALEMEPSAQDSSYSTDSTAFIASFNKAAEQFIELQRVANIESPSDEDRFYYATLVDSATTYFEDALILNPFDAQTRVILAQLYSIKAARLNQRSEFENSIEILEKLSRLEQGDPIIYAILAENYFLLERYSKSAMNYRKAVDLLLQTGTLSEIYLLNQQYSSQDSVDLFTYHYYEGQSYLKLFDEFASKTAFELADKFTTNEDYQEIIEGEIRFIDWDEGNIRASYARDSLIQLASDSAKEALLGYQILLPTLRSQRAKDEIEWRTAILNYELGEAEKAAEILLNLSSRIDLLESGIAVDSTYQQYLEDFGVITFNIGQEFLNQRKRRLALTYFLQSGQVAWEFNSRALLRVATILQNNTEESLRFARLAESKMESLNREEQKTLFQLFVNQYRRKGEIEEARRYYGLWSRL